MDNNSPGDQGIRPRRREKLTEEERIQQEARWRAMMEQMEAEEEGDEEGNEEVRFRL
jgi:hypothetical protein